MAHDKCRGPLDNRTETLLQLIVMAGIADRLKAMTIRGEQGDQAAIDYLKHCTILDEPYGSTTWRPDLRLVVDNTGHPPPDEPRPEHAQ